MYARKTTFVTKKVKRRQNKDLQRSVKTACKSENHEKTTKNTPYTLNNAHKAPHRCINTKKTLQ
jgi:hypothetical protein